VTPQAEAILELFRSTGAYLEGHFRLTSGLHSAEYLQCALVLQHPAAAEHLGKLLAEELRRLVPEKIDLVVSPALGGLIIGHEVARALGTRFQFTERDPATRAMSMRRGFTVSKGERAVVVEDVITTGGSTAEVISVLRAAGAEVSAAGSVIDRSGGSADVGVPRVALATLRVAAHEAAECPLCQRGIPVVKPGSRPT
jgi:orotate phosphoribosyltransferase